MKIDMDFMWTLNNSFLRPFYPHPYLYTHLFIYFFMFLFFRLCLGPLRHTKKEAWIILYISFFFGFSDKAFARGRNVSMYGFCVHKFMSTNIFWMCLVVALFLHFYFISIYKHFFHIFHPWLSILPWDVSAIFFI